MPETKLEAPRPRSAARDRLVGIALIAGALVCFSCLDAIAKWLGGELHPLQVTWARYTASVLIVFAFINPWTHPGVLATKRPWLQSVRSLLLLGSTAFNFFALQHLQLAETMSIMFMAPFLVALISVPLLGEWIGRRRLLVICVGFLGVLIVLRPGLGGLPVAAVLSVLGAFCYAVYSITTRMLAASDSTETTMVYSGLAGTLALTPVLGLFWTPPASAATWLLMALMGGFAALGHWLLIKAHRLAPAAILAPFIYSQIVWMVLLGWLVFGQLPDRWTFIGGAIVVACGVYLILHERGRAPTAAAE